MTSAEKFLPYPTSVDPRSDWLIVSDWYEERNWPDRAFYCRSVYEALRYGSVTTIDQPAFANLLIWRANQLLDKTPKDLIARRMLAVALEEKNEFLRADCHRWLMEWEGCPGYFSKRINPPSEIKWWHWRDYLPAPLNEFMTKYYGVSPVWSLRIGAEDGLSLVWREYRKSRPKVWLTWGIWEDSDGNPLLTTYPTNQPEVRAGHVLQTVFFARTFVEAIVHMDKFYDWTTTPSEDQQEEYWRAHRVVEEIYL